MLVIVLSYLGCEIAPEFQKLGCHLHIVGSRAVADLVEGGPRMWENNRSVPGQVKAMTYKIYTHHFLTWRLALIGYGKGAFVQCQDNVTGWDIGVMVPMALYPSGAAL